MGDDFSEDICAKVMPFFHAIRLKSDEVIFIDKTEKITKNECSILDLKLIKGIDDYAVIRSDDVRINVLKVEPINFNLKTKNEQNSILESYKILLKQCNFDFQIYIQTQKVDVEKHIKEVKKCVEFEKEISEMAEDYIGLINDTINSKSSISRKFYVIFEEKENDSRESLVEECLKMCGNMTSKCSKNEILKLFKSCFQNNYLIRLYLKTRKEE